MGETDGSSSAAQGARMEDESSEGLLSRWWRALGNATEQEDGASMSPSGDTRADAVRSLANLTRLRVEDVMIPRVEVVSAAVDVMYLIEKVSKGYERERIGEYGGDDDNLPRGYVASDDDEEWEEEEDDDDEWEDEDDDFFSS